MPSPKITDDDQGQISATVFGKEIRGWSYKDDAERSVKMLAAQEFAEGWFQARNQLKHAYPVVSHRQNSDGSAMGNGSGLEPWKAKSTGFAGWFAE